jgi:hypothetical protein
MSAAMMGKKNALGCRHSKETRVKMAAAHKGQVPWNKGKKASPEAIAKLMGNKNALGNHFRHSDEAKRKISIARRAYWAAKKAGLSP